ncbi:hypothetical protein hrd7_12610 [Leptolinea sp. HRD-7]|nr:hypothetical protein hrd7_12610 [Leptolinea sp. HRD-7]
MLISLSNYFKNGVETLNRITAITQSGKTVKNFEYRTEINFTEMAGKSPLSLWIKKKPFSLKV